MGDDRRLFADDRRGSCNLQAAKTMLSSSLCPFFYALLFFFFSFRLSLLLFSRLLCSLPLETAFRRKVQVKRSAWSAHQDTGAGLK